MVCIFVSGLVDLLLLTDTFVQLIGEIEYRGNTASSVCVHVAVDNAWRNKNLVIALTFEVNEPMTLKSSGDLAIVPKS